jgi:RNA polymerase sigma-70 factor (ECF subfamily)
VIAFYGEGAGMATSADKPSLGRFRKASSPPRTGPPDRSGRETTEPSFDEFYAAHFYGLTIQLCAYTGDLSQAQDLVQDAFCRTFTRWSKVSQYDDPVAYVRRAAWNLATTRWRRMRTARAYAQRQRVEPADGPSPDRVALEAALATLPELQRRAVVMHYLADMSVAEIAAQQQVPEGTVKSWLHRGRNALAVRLNDARSEDRDV